MLAAVRLRNSRRFQPALPECKQATQAVATMCHDPPRCMGSRSRRHGKQPEKASRTVEEACCMQDCRADTPDALCRSSTPTNFGAEWQANTICDLVGDARTSAALPA